jgi:hypothetical protein
MPQIKEYVTRTDAPNTVQEKRMSGEEMGAVGRQFQRMGESIVGVAEVVKRRKEQDEISDITVSMSQVHTEFTNRLNEEVRKGTVNSEEFTKQYDEQISKMSEKYSTSGGREYLKKSNASMRSHFMEGAFAGQAEIAGVKARENYKTTFNNFSSGLMGDPSSFGVVLQQHNSFIEESVKRGSLPAAAAEQLRTEGEKDLAKAAVRGWADLNPAEAKAQLESGQWDSLIDGDIKKQLLGEVENEIKGREVESERQRKEQDRLKLEEQSKVQNDFLEKMVAGQLTPKDILRSNLEAFGSGSKEQFLRMLEGDVKDAQKIKTDAGVYQDVFNRVHLPDGDPRKITDENEINSYFGKGLTLSDIRALRGEFQGKGTVQGKIESQLKANIMQLAKSKLSKTNPMTGMKDAAGDEQVQKWTIFMQEQLAEGKKNGISVKDMLDPNSKEYIGKFIGNYQKTPQEIMRENMKGMRKPAPQALPDGSIPGQTQKPNPKARLPNETIAEWQKRTKGL